jgi:integrase
MSKKRQSAIKVLLPIETSSVMGKILDALPPNPEVVQYYDEFGETLRSIPNFVEVKEIVVQYSGLKQAVDFSHFGKEYGALLKHFIVYLVQQDYNMSTIYKMICCFKLIEVDEINKLFSINPTELKSWWRLVRARNYPKGSYLSLKALLRFQCFFHINGWTQNHIAIISSLPLPMVDKYAAIRTGVVFLSIEEEAKIVRYLDVLANSLVRAPQHIDDDELCSGGTLLCSYLFAVRPYQIASLHLRDVRIWQGVKDERTMVHLTFKMIKQRMTSKVYPITRRVKHEWTNIILEQHQRRRNKGMVENDYLFDIESANEMSKQISRIASKLVGRKILAGHLRHTGAQRLVDAGASQEEVASFLGHSDNTSCMVYFDTSPNHAYSGERDR